MTPTKLDGAALPVLATCASLVTTAATAAVCAVPLGAILLGVGGLGWLTRYAHLRVPASVATATLLTYGFYRVYWRSRHCPRPQAGRHSNPAILLWLGTALAVTVNLFEYVVLPRFG